MFSGLPKNYWILWTGALVNRLGSFVMPLLALYLSGPRGLSVQQVGYVLTLFGAGTLCAGPLGGFLADRIGRRRTLILALVVGALAMLHLAFARSVPHITFAALLLGLLGDLYRPAVSAAIADMVPSKDRVRAYGLLYWAVNLGFAVGSAAGGALASYGWYLLFVGDAATTLAYAAIVWLRIPETRHVAAGDEHAPPWAAVADGPFVAFCGLTMLVWMMFFQVFTTLPIDMRSHGIAPSMYGSLIALNGFMIFALQPFVAKALARFARHRVLAIAGAMVGAGFGSTAMVNTPRGYALSIAA